MRQATTQPTMHEVGAPQRRLQGKVLMAAGFLALLWLERRRPLRRRVEPALPHTVRNGVLAAAAALTVAGVESPITRRVAHQVERYGWGLVPRLPFLSSPCARTVLSLLLMDYTLYWWHVLLHRVPLLWKAHLVHHADLDLDVTTALRFQFIELLWSVPWRVAQIALIGVPPRTLRLWARLTLLEVMFHHSNLRLPIAFERLLARLVATPRVHGIHHSAVRSERNRNYSSGLALWDLLHGTWRLDVPQSEITIGLPRYRRPTQVDWRWSLLEPLRGGSPGSS